jgi:antitoxin (DNA-binding transcriptional repressor) of toxin-antitoxin stability system
MKTIASTSARRSWSNMLGRVQHRGQRFAIVRNGRLIAALIPYNEVAILRQLEDELDFHEAREAVELDRGKKRLDWDEILRYAELGE